MDCTQRSTPDGVTAWMLISVHHDDNEKGKTSWDDAHFFTGMMHASSTQTIVKKSKQKIKRVKAQEQVKTLKT
eukprot:c12365_g1_i1 orf=518-736(+)